MACPSLIQSLYPLKGFKNFTGVQILMNFAEEFGKMGTRPSPISSLHSRSNVCLDPGFENYGQNIDKNMPVSSIDLRNI